VLHELERHPQGCPEHLTKQICYQTLLGVAYCHKQGCLHRDIKPENILLTAQGQVKLCRSVNSLRDFFVGPTEVNTEARNEN